jgi:uncharacterized protein YoxC
MNYLITSVLIFTFMVPMATYAQEEVILPTNNPVRYWWERVVDNIQTAFTFNIERKAELYENQLKRLDNKLEACADDTECAAKIEARINRLTDRTEKFIEKHEKLRDRLIDKFEKKEVENSVFNKVHELEKKVEDRKQETIHRVEEFSREYKAGEKVDYKEEVNVESEDGRSKVNIQQRATGSGPLNTHMRTEIKIDGESSSDQE